MNEFYGASPQDIYEAYRNGFTGCIYEPRHLDALLGKLPHPLFGAAADELMGSGKGKLSLPFKEVLKFDKNPWNERQTTGDCVSHGTRNAVDVTRAVEISLKNKPYGWVERGATEAIYGSRGHGGQGMSCSRAAEYVNTIGGIVLRKNYPGIIDLSTYNGNIGANWGRSGVPAAVQALGKNNKVRTISLVTTIDEARDALANGYGVCVCSGHGFSKVRDSKGIARKEGSWAHAMAWTACDDTGSEPLFLVQNSWGKWNSGGHPDWGPIPDGSFLIRADDAAAMLRGRGSFAFSNVDGFPPQKLPDYGAGEFL